MRCRLTKLAAVATLAISANILSIYPAVAANSSALEAGSTVLDPGEFIWQPERSRTGDVSVVVSIPLQAVYVYRGGTLIGVSTASTGRPGHDTPTGTFEILQKRRDHKSNLYDDAPMPFMQRLTWDGIALHGGTIPGYPASHGCVRLPTAFARHLFAATELGASVHIVDSAPSPEEAQRIALRGIGGGLELATAD
ncbi:MAG TPA: L,D-transpeptidase family protein [Allosphingosinicella sp.]|nr:L,D-transpeptidase family protein [Allosphingosinicella sp.]